MGRPHLLLLHGALGAKTQFQTLIPYLQEYFTLHRFDFEGHGQSMLKDRPLREVYFAENVLDYLNNHSIERVHIFGHSLGGQVGLYLASHFPERISGVFTLGTKFLWSNEIAARENAFLQPEVLLRKVPQFVEELKRRHVAIGWELLLEKIREMHTHTGSNSVMTSEEICRIPTPVRICVGDRDRMTTIEESITIYHLLQKGELQVFPHTPHPLEQISTKILATAILDFFC